MKAVIMCGGVGSRLKPLTENSPKPMLRLMNRPVIDIIIEKLIKSGIEKIYISLGYMAQDIISYCENKNYSANIIFKEEFKPLGTAGGVKNCIGQSNDDILIVSGDNVFDFDLTKMIDYHIESEADITVCGIAVDDPREYGVILKDDNNSIISFSEKPTWEQAESNIVNTGIYIMKGDILDLIPNDTFYDFSENLFPEIFTLGKRFKCFSANGYWGDMGEFDSYKQVSADILNGKLKNFTFEDDYIYKDIITKEGGVITAPCLIGKNVIIETGAKIGPYVTIGDNSKIKKNTSITNSIIGDNVEISVNSDITSSIISDCVKIYDNCVIEENCVLAYGCSVGRFSRILANNKIWPGRNISSESVVGKDMFYETPEKIELDVFGLSGTINSQFNVSDAVKIGQALASIKKDMRIGIGYDGHESAAIFKDGLGCGIRTCSPSCYDFEEMFKVQAFFYSAYCSLDMFIFVSVNSEIINLSFFGPKGLPISSRVSRIINNNYKYSSFKYLPADECKEKFNMNLFSTVYKSFFKKMCGEDFLKIKVNVETDNIYIKNLFAEVFEEDNTNSLKESIQILINANGSDLYILEKEKFYSSERLFVLLSEIEFAAGHDLIIPEDAPDIIEEKALFYGRKVFRVFECSRNNYDITNEKVLSNLWCFDSVLMCAKIIHLLTLSGESLESLFEYQKDFSQKKFVLEYTEEPIKIREVLNSIGEKKNSDDIFYIVNNRKGKAKLRQMGNSNKIRVLVEAADMETAKEMSIYVSEKIKNAYIDKNK